MLNPSSPLPLYIQLFQILKNKIESNEYKEGSLLPSEPALTNFYKIGRPTVREALRLLEQEGYIKKIRGKGSFVCGPKEEISLFSLAGASAAFKEKNLIVKRKIVDALTEKLVSEAERKNPFCGEKTYFFSRLTSLRGKPFIYEEIWLGIEVFPGLTKFDLAKDSLSRIAREHYFLKPVLCRQTFEVSIKNNPAQLQSTKIDNALLLVCRTIYFKSEKPAIFSKIFARTNQFTFYQELRD